MKILSVDKDKVQVELTREELSVLVGPIYSISDTERNLRDSILNKFEEIRKDLKGK